MRRLRVQGLAEVDRSAHRDQEYVTVKRTSVRYKVSGRVYCFPCSAPLDLLSSCPMRVSHIRFQRPQTSRTLDAMMVNRQVPRPVNSTSAPRKHAANACAPLVLLAFVPRLLVLRELRLAGVCMGEGALLGRYHKRCGHLRVLISISSTCRV